MSNDNKHMEMTQQAKNQGLMTMSQDIETIYRDTIVSLRSAIELEFGSLKAFCDQHGIDKFNLYKVFKQTKGRELSIGMYLKIIDILQHGAPQADEHLYKRTNMSLKDYLAIDNNRVMKSMIFLAFN
jgi:hypothetical protein